MNDVAHYVKMRKAWPVTKVAEFPGWAVCVLLAVTGAECQTECVSGTGALRVGQQKLDKAHRLCACIC